jgi:hypothetical protein
MFFQHAVCGSYMSKLRLVFLALAISGLFAVPTFGKPKEDDGPPPGNKPNPPPAAHPTQISTNCYDVPNNRVQDCGFENSGAQTAPFPTSPWKGKNMAVPLCPLEINTASQCGRFSGGFAPFERTYAVYHGFDGGGPVKHHIDMCVFHAWKHAVWYWCFA